MPEKIKPLTAGWILFFVYVVGIIGLAIPATRPLLQQLVWVNLLFTMIVLFCYHKKWTKEFIFSIVLIGFSGFLIEVLGVKTGQIFGYYRYGYALGFKLWDTPIMMAVNWIITIYITRQIAEMIAKDAFLISLLASALMVLLDYFLEYFAIRFNLWQWNSGTVPFRNYVGWFVCGLVLHYLFQKAIKFPPNKLALPVYLILLGFFMILFFLFNL